VSRLQAHRVVIVGGGYTGAACAVQLARASSVPLDITIVDPRKELGRGRAYTAPDPDHRLNGGIDNHVIDLADPGELQRWCDANGILAKDPEAVARNGNVFIRRHDFGHFVGDTVRAHSRLANGTTITHRRDMAIDAAPHEGGVRVDLAEGSNVEAQLLVIATGNPPLRFPRPWAERLAGDPRAIADPFDAEALRGISPDARVLLLGTGLTTLDVATTLLRREHRGPIVALSRRGLRPALHRLAPPVASPTFLERVEAPLPAWVEAATRPATARGLLRALRARIREVEREGGTWYAPFDEMRNGVWRFWPGMAPREKRRFLRWLRNWYDMHRFRAPPQNDALVRAGEAQGRITFRTGRVRDMRPGPDGIAIEWHTRDGGRHAEHFDAVINCTGLDAASGAQENPFLRNLLARGLLAVDPSGLGFAADERCRALDARGEAQPRLRLLGPPSAGTFGDPLGVLFISPQIRRAVPGMLDLLG
jgi:uncharacterized NAD(P)/FAD-binding protein YdhS